MGCGASKVSNQVVPSNDKENENINGNNKENKLNKKNSKKELDNPNRSETSINKENENAKDSNITQEENPSSENTSNPDTSENDSTENKNVNTLNNKASAESLSNNQTKNNINSRSGENLNIDNTNLVYTKPSDNSTKPQNLSATSNGKLSLNSLYAPLPAIASKTRLKPISFEIPVDKSMICKTVKPSFKGSLPKLSISEDELKKKIGNVENKWKDISVSKGNNFKKNQLFDENLEALKMRLLEKEAEAAMNRQKELDKLKAKLEKAQRHALKVQERKRRLEAEWMSKSATNLEMKTNTYSRKESDETLVNKSTSNLSSNSLKVNSTSGNKLEMEENQKYYKPLTKIIDKSNGKNESYTPSINTIFV